MIAVLTKSIYSLLNAEHCPSSFFKTEHDLKIQRYGTTYDLLGTLQIVKY